MSSRSETITRILDSAESHICKKGYNAFSFREIAHEIGIKSASVHYHFPTKANLAAAVVLRYTDSFIKSLGEPNSPNADAKDLLKNYIQEFQNVLISNDSMCLGGILSAELTSLPDEVADATRQFFIENLRWLTDVLQLHFGVNDIAISHFKAMKILAMLEGTLIVMRSLNREVQFEEMVEDFLNLS
ncbi:hypothetical protein LCGC14_0907480 [marine sediment metagenome]|uniref:HTH tetR-type domain-containing protein n=1 Tax=marine sediment metagenome TaxID=412755 RepID=A0A0F9NZ83_9ZZZZ|nr:TetR/AcrR family transcriptional regulator [Methylophaga sp.]